MINTPGNSHLFICFIAYGLFSSVEFKLMDCGCLKYNSVADSENNANGTFQKYLSCEFVTELYVLLNCSRMGVERQDLGEWIQLKSQNRIHAPGSK